eukprot:Hpha_TRINITY_DN8787_c0_g1::TRINITY_DN8787_c0_g1_i1::g.45219::m.45219
MGRWCHQWVGVVVVICAVVTEGKDMCTDKDIAKVFTECFEEDGEQVAQVVEVVKKDCQPRRELAAPQTVPCDGRCGDGQFYSASAGGKCTACPEGTFSSVNAREITEWSVLPTGFTTFCNPEPCQSWNSDPDFPKVISSGNQSGTRRNWQTQMEDETVDSRLTFIADVTMQKGGWLYLEHRVESEWFYDGLYLFLNGTIYIPPKAKQGQNFLDSGLYYRWHHTNVSLPFGRTSVRLSYMKDQNQASPLGNHVGEDRAFIRGITVYGARHSVRHCSECPFGSLSKSGSTECTMCPRNTQRGEGDSGGQCLACDTDTHWALPGSAKCTRKKPCTSADYVPVYGPCKQVGEELQREQRWEAANPVCIDKESNRPATKQVNCSQCMDGFRRDGLSCVSCPLGEALVNNNTCQACPAGQIAVRGRVYRDFDPLDGNLTGHGFKTECTPYADCRDASEGSNAWELRRLFEKGTGVYVTVLSSGQGHGASVESTLTLYVETYMDGILDFEYVFEHFQEDLNLDQVTGTFTINDRPGVPVWQSDHALEVPLNRFNNIDKIGSLRNDIAGLDDDYTDGYPLRANTTYELRWVFEKNNLPAEVSLNLRSLSITGVRDGASAGCIDCPQGHACPEGSHEAKPCPKGSYQDAVGATACKECPASEVAPNTGSSRCDVCGLGTGSSPAHDRCQSECVFETPAGGLVDLRPIGHRLLGPAVDVKDLMQKEHLGITPDAALRLFQNDSQSRTEADNAGVHRYFLKLCEFVNDGGADEQRSCPETRWDTDIDQAYVCQRISTDRGYSLGNWVQYTPLPEGKGVNITFTGGDICRLPGKPPFPRSTSVTLECDLSAADDTLTFVQEVECQYFFRFATPYACAMCTNESYDFVDSECNAQTRTVTRSFYKRPTEFYCFGGVPLPQQQTVPCKPACTDDDWDTQWGECDMGYQTQLRILTGDCTLDQNRPEPHLNLTTRKCHVVDVRVGANKVTFTALFIISILIALCLCLIITVKKNRDLQQEYEVLARAHVDHPEDQGEELCDTGGRTSVV